MNNTKQNTEPNNDDFERYWQEQGAAFVALKLFTPLPYTVDHFKSLCLNMYLKGCNDTMKIVIKEIKGS